MRKLILMQLRNLSDTVTNYPKYEVLYSSLGQQLSLATTGFLLQQFTPPLRFFSPTDKHQELQNNREAIHQQIGVAGGSRSQSSLVATVEVSVPFN